jgi:hypothetical protein
MLIWKALETPQSSIAKGNLVEICGTFTLKYLNQTGLEIYEIEYLKVLG